MSVGMSRGIVGRAHILSRLGLQDLCEATSRCWIKSSGINVHVPYQHHTAHNMAISGTFIAAQSSIKSQSMGHNVHICRQHIHTHRKMDLFSVEKSVIGKTHLMPFVSVMPCRQKGHNKFSNIKDRKAAMDKVKMQKSSQMATMAVTAIKEGGIDVSTNKKLANLYSTAKKLNVPKSTLDGIIKKAVERVKTHSEFMTGMQGPHGTFFIISAFTKNKTFLFDALKILKKKGCRFIDAADAIRVFEVKGQVTTLRPDVKDLEELAIEVEAEDFSEEKDEDGQELVQFTCDGNDLLTVKKNLEQQGAEIVDFKPLYIPYTPLELTEDQEGEIATIIDIIEAYEDLISYSHNI